MGNETGETRTPRPFPLGHGARHLKRAKSLALQSPSWRAGVRSYFRFLIFTVARTNEVLGARWSERLRNACSKTATSISWKRDEECGLYARDNFFDRPLEERRAEFENKLAQALAARKAKGR